MKANATCFLEFKMLWCWDPDRVHLLSFSPPIPSVFADRLQCLWQEQPTLLFFCKDDKRTNLLWGRLGISVTSSPVGPGRISFVSMYPPLSRLIHAHGTHPGGTRLWRTIHHSERVLVLKCNLVLTPVLTSGLAGGPAAKRPPLCTGGMWEGGGW